MILAIGLALLTIGLFLLRRRVRVGGHSFAWRTWFSVICGAVAGYVLITFILQFGEPSALAILPQPVWKLFMVVTGVFMLGPVIRAALGDAIPPSRQQDQDDTTRRRG